MSEERAPYLDDAPDTVTLRVARIVWLMAQGRWLTTIEIAHLTNLPYGAAHAMMERLTASEHVPVTSRPTGIGRLLEWGIYLDISIYTLQS